MARHWLRSIGAAEPSHGHLVEEIPVMQCSRLLFELHALFGAFLEIRVLRHDKLHVRCCGVLDRGNRQTRKKFQLYANTSITKQQSKGACMNAIGDVLLEGRWRCILRSMQ